MIKLKFKTLFIVLILYSIPHKMFAQANDSLLTQLTRKWSNAKAYTVKIAELMPEEFYDFKPVPEEMSFKQQLLHIAQNIQWLSSSYLLSNKKIIPEDTAVKHKDAVIHILKNAYDMAMETHHNLTLKQLDEVVSFFAGPMSRRQILLLLHDHQTHHVGQIIVYMRLKNIKPPAYIGW